MSRLGAPLRGVEDRPGGTGHPHPQPTDDLILAGRPFRRVHGDPRGGPIPTPATRQRDVDRIRYDVREVEQLEGGLVGYDRHLRARRQPGRHHVSPRRARIVTQSVNASVHPYEPPVLRMVRQEGPAVAAGPSLSGSEVAALLGGDLEELLSSRRCVIHMSNNTLYIHDTQARLRH